MVGCYIVLEATQGATVGKMALGLRVVKTNGAPFRGAKLPNPRAEASSRPYELRSCGDRALSWDFMQKMERAHLVRLRKVDRGYLVELVEGESVEVPPSSERGGGSEAAGEHAPPAAPPSEAGSAEAMNLLRQAVAAASTKSPNRPLYMRQIRQALRSADKDFDERRYGFRGFLDLLHHAQREGWLHLQRDHKGVWRIFPKSSALADSSASIAATEPASEPAAATGTEVAPLAPTPITEAFSEPEAAAPIEAESPRASAPPIEETTAQIVAEPRKSSAARGTGKRGRRKTSTRRKPKEPNED